MTKEENDKEKSEELELCPLCGRPMIEEDGEWICPDCSEKIDFFGDDSPS